MKELKVTPIKDGTVIDHITPGRALKVLHILKIPESTVWVVSILMNVNGKKGKKDIVKIENRELDPKEVDKIALIAPKAT
ncbi:MAG: aspartate carbamoyltransferase regulatory subunit, partial [Candidatus Thermoplasmatota archaeon]|nr:aspartate carbamoyltransferase regulatory subunit [Candidatus Thermoplasmatota archaeon]